MKKILGIILVFILTIVMAINLLIIFNIPFLGIKLYRVGSGSMSPYLKINDIIIVKSQNKYQINDVITYKNNNNEIITHRVIKVDDNKIITKGDMNNMEDSPIIKNNIIGKVIFKTSLLGFIIYLFNKPIFWILMLILGIITLICIPDKRNV